MNEDISHAETLIDVGGKYVALERRVRHAIDQIVSPVCSACIRICCKGSYCKETLKNPWYLFLYTQFNGEQDIDWGRSSPPPGLRRNGCEIRAGRYAYCYAYNCRAVLISLKTDEEKTCFQELSEIIKEIGLNFAGKKHLTDIRDWGDLTRPRLQRLNEKIKVGEKRFTELSSHLFYD